VWGFRLDTATVNDDDTTLVPVLDESVDTGGKDSKKLKSANHKKALEALHEALDAHGKPSPGSTGTPSNSTVTTRETWQTYAAPKMTGSDSKRQNENFNRALTALYDKGLIGLHGDYVWEVKP
jgi:hypothetical protein